ncbi:hypothetical protein [Rhizorhapis suberifaciens]|uniref:Uncharacterized protein n=1 Tax=Rhizorhapis suberifaciens TaxID=13656 RepID=A0A840HZ86_9SPHN|nr:hypothetical protein [Rhizorhapis suberifaciens]MBB4642880.1 hypothetical protein [Rhizorhapis suberifaciens]
MISALAAAALGAFVAPLAHTENMEWNTRHRSWINPGPDQRNHILLLFSQFIEDIPVREDCYKIQGQQRGVYAGNGSVNVLSKHVGGRFSFASGKYEAERMVYFASHIRPAIRFGISNFIPNHYRCAKPEHHSFGWRAAEVFQGIVYPDSLPGNFARYISQGDISLDFGVPDLSCDIICNSSMPERAPGCDKSSLPLTNGKNYKGNTNKTQDSLNASDPDRPFRPSPNTLLGIKIASSAIFILLGVLAIFDGFQRARYALKAKRYFLGWGIIFVGACMLSYGVIEVIDPYA